MTDLKNTLHEVLGKELRQSNYDLIDIVSIPIQGDRMVRLRTLEEALEEFDQSDSNNRQSYLIQLKQTPQIQVPSHEIQDFSPIKPSLDGIYLPNGKLNVPFLVQNAELLFASGEYQLSKNIFRTILQSGERTALALHWIGRCLEAEGKIEEASSHYEESLAYHPALEVYRRLFSLLTKQKKELQAVDVLIRALNLKEISQKHRFDLYREIGHSYARQQKTADAEKYYKKALETEPRSDEIRVNLGALYLQNGSVAEAKRHFQDALASNPKNDKALSGMGSCYLAENDKQTAHNYFAMALEVELNNPTAVFHLVKCAYEIKSYTTAARLMEEYITVAPVNANLLYSLAGLHFHLGKMDQAKATAEKILELAPEHDGAEELLELIEKYATDSDFE